MNKENKEELRKKFVNSEDIFASTTLYDKNNIN
jgi:hypothetical protein